MKSLVPYAQGLSHSMETTDQAPDVSLLARYCETRRLLHELDLVLRQYPIEESGFHVVLAEGPVVGCGKVKDSVH